MKKDIKSKTIDNSTVKFPVESKTWKSDIRRALSLNYEVEALNEEQAEYIKKIKTKLEEKAAKAKVKEELKQKALAKMTDAMKAIKAKIVSAANDLADRIILNAIEKEEQQKRFAEKDKQIKEKVKKDKLASAKKKRERKAELRNKTIPSPEAIAAAKRQQDFLSKTHAVKREEIEARLKKKEEFMNQSTEEYATKHKIRIEKDVELAKKRLHHDEIKLKHTTKAERIEAVKAQKEAGKIAFNKEMQKQASEIEADRQGYADRVAKNQRLETERLARLAERRKLRNDKVFAEHLKQQKIQQLNLQRFIESEKARLARKEEKRAKYLTKGNIETPKVKNKVALDKTRVEEYIKVAEKKMNEEENTGFVVCPVYTDKPKTTKDNSKWWIFCSPDKIENHLRQRFNQFLKKNPDTFIGIYVYDKDQCIYEILNDKFKDRSKLTSKNKAA